MSEKADLEVVNRTLAAVVQKQEEELKQARADYERLRSRMAMWSNAIKIAQDNEREIERLRAALEKIAANTYGYEPNAMSDEEAKVYFANLFFAAQGKARAALNEGKSK